MDFDDLAEDPRFISGIYNFCDRWCERCSLAHRCLTRAMEMTERYDEGDEAEKPTDPQASDTENARFWEELQSSLDEKNEALDQEAGLASSIFDDPEVEARMMRREQRKERLAAGHPVATISRDYMDATRGLFDSLNALVKQRQQALESGTDGEFEPAEKIVDLDDCVEVIGWYHTLIRVKLSRALMSAGDEAEETDPEMLSFPKDSDASAKISLIGIDRSVAAWTQLGKLLGTSPETTAFKKPLALPAKLRVVTESTFPHARTFIRPGFDEPPE